MNWLTPRCQALSGLGGRGRDRPCLYGPAVTQDSFVAPLATSVAPAQTATSGLCRVIWRHEHRFFGGARSTPVAPARSIVHNAPARGIACHDGSGSRQGRTQVGGHSRG